MKRVTDHIRDHALSVVGYYESHRVPSIEELAVSEWNPTFERMMRNRLIMGAFRYGLFRDKLAGKHGWDLVGYLKRKVADYEATGNLEFLVDAANMALLEFTAPTHPNAHISATDCTGVHCERRLT